MNDVFISHVELDKAIAFEIAFEIEKAGYSTWYYERDSAAGISYLEQTQDAIVSCQAMVLLISRHSIGSFQVSREVVRAFESNIRIVPLLLDITDAEYKRKQPEWKQALGAATSLTISSNTISEVIPRVLRGLEKLNIVPHGTTTVTDPESILRARAESAQHTTTGNNSVQDSFSSRKATPRIITAGAIGILGILFNFSNIFKILLPDPFLTNFYAMFPIVKITGFIVTIINCILSVAVISGAWMCYSLNPSGPKRLIKASVISFITVASWLIMVLLGTMATSNWSPLPDDFKSQTIGTFIMLAALGCLAPGIIYFLFHTSENKSAASPTT